MPSVPSLALGAGEVTLESLTTRLRACLPAGGVRRTPTYIKRVEDADGRRALSRRRTKSEQVISPQTAFLMTHMLADVVNHGTA